MQQNPVLPINTGSTFQLTLSVLPSAKTNRKPTAQQRSILMQVNTAA